MSTPHEQGAPKLRPPGAGIPRWQAVLARRVLLPLYIARHPWDAVPELLRAQARELATEFERELAAGGVERLRRRVLIPPTPGLEDDSRYWSLVMIPDHLRRVNARLIEVVRSLAAGAALPEGPTAIADFKPNPGAGPEVVAEYLTVTDELARTIAGAPASARASRGTVAHPWFGELVVRQWVPFGAMHQGIHRRQWGLIRARL